MSREFSPRSQSHQQHSSTHNKFDCHLRRSNAMRIRSRNCYVLSQNSNYFRVQQVSENKNEDRSSILDQIKRGVRLHKYRESSKIESSSRNSSQQIKRLSSSSDRVDNQEEENLSTILARVLEKRNLVMQQTDEESELSSIDSRPEQQYELLDESLNDDEVVSSNSETDLNTTENMSSYSYDNIDCFGGKIELIMRL